jgi:hypothetical protein|tara:strand:+ start:2570 stop:3721 length:1152 start_codon:yes stop_codon:yes gene_type:complete
MANAIIWPGSSSFFPGDTPFGFYDNDSDFQQDADKVTVFCSRRLGYPLTDIELQDLNFYTAFEEAVTTYGNEVYAYQASENYLSIEGSQTGSNLNYKLQKSNLGNEIRIAEGYGTEAGVGGSVEYYSGSINLITGQQTYDLNDFATSQSISTGDLEIREVYYQEPPAIVRYFDPYAGTGTDVGGLLDSFGFGNFSPGINFMMMPINYDLQKIQAIEFNDQIRKANYSFELVNNKLRIFPIPKRDYKLYFKYLLKSQRNNPLVSGSIGTGVVTDISTVPYTNPTYSFINSIGRQWIFEYTLALSKEMLGYVRGKYGTIPIPNADVTLNHGDLITAATAEKATLIERLRAYLEETSKSKLLEKKANDGDALKRDFTNVPYTIYVG